MSIEVAAEKKPRSRKKSVAPQAEAANFSLQEVFQVGAVRQDGYIYVALSEDPKSPRFQKPLWVAPQDEAKTMTWDRANKISAERYTNDRATRLPTPIELHQIFNAEARGEITGFSKTPGPSTWYWAYGHSRHDNAACQRFSDGRQDFASRSDEIAVRYVR